MPKPIPYSRAAHRAEVSADRLGTTEKRRRAAERVAEITAGGGDRRSLRLAWRTLHLLGKIEQIEAELEASLKQP